MTTPIVIGAPITGLSGTAGDSFYFTLDVVPGVAYTLELTAPPECTADVDLVYALGRAFEYGDEDNGSYSGSADEIFTYTSDVVGTLYVVVYGYEGDFTGLSLSATTAPAVPLGRVEALKYSRSPLPVSMQFAVDDPLPLAGPTGTWVAYAYNNSTSLLYAGANPRELTLRSQISKSVNSIEPLASGRFLVSFSLNGVLSLYETTDFITLTPRVHPTGTSGAVTFAEFNGALYAMSISGAAFVSHDRGDSWASHATDLPALASFGYSLALKTVGDKLALVGATFAVGGAGESRTYLTSDASTWTQVPGFYVDYTMAAACASGTLIYGASYISGHTYFAVLDTTTAAVSIIVETFPIRLAVTANYAVLQCYLPGASQPSWLAFARDGSQHSIAGFSLGGDAARVAASPVSDDLVRTQTLTYLRCKPVLGNLQVDTIGAPVAPAFRTLVHPAMHAPTFVDEHYAYALYNQQVVFRADRNTGAYIDGFVLGEVYGGGIHVGGGRFVYTDTWRRGVCITYDGPTGAVSVETLVGIPTGDSFTQPFVEFTGQRLLARGSAGMFVSSGGRVWEEVTARFPWMTSAQLRYEQGTPYRYDFDGKVMHVVEPDFSADYQFALDVPTPFVAYNAQTQRLACIAGDTINVLDLGGAVVSTYRVPTDIANYAMLLPLGTGFVAANISSGVTFTQDGSSWLQAPWVGLVGSADIYTARALSNTRLELRLSSFGFTPGTPSGYFGGKAVVFDLTLFWTGFINCEDAA